MRKKKVETAVASQGVELPEKHGGKTEETPTPTATVTFTPVSDGVIDLDPTTGQFPHVHGAGAGAASGNGGVVTGKTEYHVENHVGETVVLRPGQHAVSLASQKVGSYVAEQAQKGATITVTPKRKYTKHIRVGTKQTVTPTFVDRAAIRAARIQIFVGYVDGKINFTEAAHKDDQFRNLDAVAKEIEEGTTGGK